MKTKPPPLRVSFAESRANADPREVIVEFTAGKARKTVAFRSSGPPLLKSGDALLCLGLVPAMELQCDLVVDAPIDDLLFENVKKIQALLCSWYPGYRAVVVTANSRKAKYSGDRGQAIFFSGGVDSSFSLAQASSRLSGMVTVIGADVDPAVVKEVRHLEKTVQAVATAYDLESIRVETDLRRVSDKLVGWVEYHGAVLAAIAHMLGDRFENFLVASSADESSWSRRWGSHPALDPLYGSSGLGIEHHGLVHRLAKIERLLGEPVLMAQLRVCDYAADNCGTCEDCTFMLKALDVLDATDRAPTFRAPEAGTRQLIVTGEGSKSDLAHMRMRAMVDGNSNGLAEEIRAANRWYETKKRIFGVLPLPEIKRKLKRLKRQYRYLRWSRQG
jgi:hypothetical protein